VRTLARDEDLNLRAAHWGDLHRRLHEELPPAVTVLWGHQFLSFEAPDDTRGVVATARVLRTGETVEVTGDLLIAADGSTSSVRRSFLPDLKLRFSFLPIWLIGSMIWSRLPLLRSCLQDPRRALRAGQEQAQLALVHQRPRTGAHGNGRPLAASSTC